MLAEACAPEGIYLGKSPIPLPHTPADGQAAAGSTRAATGAAIGDSTEMLSGMRGERDATASTATGMMHGCLVWHMGLG